MVITLEMEMILLSPGIRRFFSDQSIKTTGPILWKSIHQNIKDSGQLNTFVLSSSVTIYQIIISKVVVFGA